MRRASFVLSLRTWAFCVLGVLALVCAGYGLNAAERHFFPTGARGSAEWLFLVPVLILVGFGIAILYVALVALLTAVAAVLPEGRIRTYIDGQLEQSGTLERTVSSWLVFSHSAWRRLITLHKWGPGAVVGAVKFVAISVLVLVGVAACTYGAGSLYSSLSGAPAWAFVIIVLLALLLFK